MNYYAPLNSMFFLPSYLYLFKYNQELARLYFYILLSGIAFYEVINKKMYLFDNLESNHYIYNYVGDQCRSIVFQYFIVDIFFTENKVMFFHHCLILFAIFLSFINNEGYYLTIYLSLNEISTIFLSLKILNIYKNISNILFMFNFFIFRIILLPILTYHYKNIYHIFYILLLDDFLHIYWVVKLSKKFLLFN